MVRTRRHLEARNTVRKLEEAQARAAEALATASGLHVRRAIAEARRELGEALSAARAELRAADLDGAAQTNLEDELEGGGS